MHPFKRSGFAALSDLQSKEWREIYDILEKDQAEFLKYEKEFRSKEYKWPRDPLHNWSRVWEYPYVYYHLKRFRENWTASRLPRVIDFGSGSTFFPFVIANLGYHVICVDTDCVCINSVNKATEILELRNGSIETATAIDEVGGIVDLVYSISVIEHIKNYVNVSALISRKIDDSGLFVITVDVSDDRNSTFTSCDFKKFLKFNLEKYHLLFGFTRVKNTDVLNSTNYKYKLAHDNSLFRFLIYVVKNHFFKTILGLRHSSYIKKRNISVMGIVFIRNKDLAK